MPFADHIKPMLGRFKDRQNSVSQAIMVQPASFSFHGHRGAEAYERIEIAGGSKTHLDMIAGVHLHPTDGGEDASQPGFG